MDSDFDDSLNDFRERRRGITDALEYEKKFGALLFSVEKSASAPMHNTIFLKG